MRIYKELSFVGEKQVLDRFKQEAKLFARCDWKHSYSERMKDYIVFDYLGDKAEHAEISIYCGPDSWRKGYIKVGNIVPLDKNQLTIDEYNTLLDLFYTEVIVPNIEKIEGVKVVGPESDLFDPLKYISKDALNKLVLFCNGANKTTGASHPCDEQRWFDFICQTVDDDRVFDYDTLFRFLVDEEYWGKKSQGFIGAVGHFAWDEEHAEKLATEYDNYVRLLKFYKTKKWQEGYEAVQK